MSDPAKSAEEIEDVLASIRRLVSDHTGASRPATAVPVARPAPAPVARVAEEGERLVLTPSLRIADLEDAEAADAEADSTDRLEADAPGADALDAAEAGDDLSDSAEAEPAEAELTEPDAPESDVPESDVTEASVAEDDRVQDAEADETETLVAGILGSDEIADADDEATAEGADPEAETLAGPDATAGGADEDRETDWRPGDRMAEFDSVGHPDPASGRAAAAETGEDSEIDMAAEAGISGIGDLDPPTGDFESETGDDNWPGVGADIALRTLVARRDTAGDAAPASMTALDVAAPSPGADPGPDAEGDRAEAADEPALALRTGDEPADAQDEMRNDAADDADDALQASATEDQMRPLADRAESLTAPDAVVAVSDDDPFGQDAGMPVTPVFSRRARKAAAVSVPETDNLADEEDGIAGADDEPTPFAFDDDDENLLDEDTLREIIIDVVREELQGVLGQRITRNVRKMVRREVRLALAAEDLE